MRSERIMGSVQNIRLLGDKNERGDTFTRLSQDLFFSLGYEDIKLDVIKPGREIDIQGKHRHEERYVVAECKAHAKKMGGAELNKFYGVLTRERERKYPGQVSGYFISLNGFTSPSEDQEKESGANGSILLDASKVIEELIKSKVVIPFEVAMQKSGQCMKLVEHEDLKFSYAELIGHVDAYLYFIVYKQDNEDLYYSLIHADGSFISENTAKHIHDKYLIKFPEIEHLKYLSPPSKITNHVSESVEKSILYKYKKWIISECDYIQLDGLPADSDLSAKRLTIEQLFVPLKVHVEVKSQENIEREIQVLSVGDVLKYYRHITLLSMPGGGKSTLLKRLATAYVTDEDRNISDDLPRNDWLPIILRCRELKDKCNKSLLEIVGDLVKQAGIFGDEVAAFEKIIHEKLKVGKILLLIDGLDEISEEAGRKTFSHNLRMLIAMFPQIGVVITSRPAGYRLVAGVIASVCHQATLAPLDEADVVALCGKWHKEVINDTEKVRLDSVELANNIWSNRRIRHLTQNPLLLTTLLVVNRWVKELPKNRVALYREAIRVLVRTWNVEGYEPLDEEEALAQLSYVACAMMNEGIQQIGQQKLLKLLQQARYVLDAELQFTTISPQEFIERIEYRSSLLIQTGHDLIDNELQPVYEFRHLTFQEYLAARGFIQEQHADRNLNVDLAVMLKKHFYDQTWREVISISAVLAGRKSESIIKLLLDEIEGDQDFNSDSRLDFSMSSEDVYPLSNLLYQCLLDEVTINSVTLKDSFDKLIKTYNKVDGVNLENSLDFRIAALLNGKFNATLKQVIEDGYLTNVENVETYLDAFSALTNYEFSVNGKVLLTEELTQKLLINFHSNDRVSKAKAAFCAMTLAFQINEEKDLESSVLESFEMIRDEIVKLVSFDDFPLQLAASWALAWLGCKRLVNKPTKDLMITLYHIWMRLINSHLSHFPAWAFAAQPLLDRNTFDDFVWTENFDEYAKNLVNDEYSSGANFGILVVAWYKKSPFSDDELLDKIKSYATSRLLAFSPTETELFEQFGEAGESALAELKSIRNKKYVTQ